MKFINKHNNLDFNNNGINYVTMHPNTKDEWQFGIRTTNGKLVAVVLACAVCINIRGVSLICMNQFSVNHQKYNNKRLWFVLIKELMRRVNLYNINSFILNIQGSSILKPLSNIHIWTYSFDHMHPTNGQLPSSPRTPGWRRMTSEDVPSALALINKWSSQFEIRQVFNSEEEFAHHLLCPAVPNYVFTYVVENEANNITDLVSFRLVNDDMVFGLTTVASTQSPLKQLIIDALVCAKKLDAIVLGIQNWNIKPDVLSSLSFCYNDDFSSYFSIYNYKYYETSEAKAWYCI